MPSTYNPAIPQPGDLISVSQGDILENFFQLNDQFGKDHQPFYTGSANGDGTHKKVTMDAPLVSGSPTGTVGVWHTVAGVNAQAGSPVAYFANANGDYPILPDLKTVGSDFGFKFGNVIINWGTLNASTFPFTVTLSVPFTAIGSYIVVLTHVSANNAIMEANVTNISATQFNVYRPVTGTFNYNYIAIGT